MGLADVDPFPTVITHLGNHVVVTENLGGPGRVGDANKPPYPRIRVSDPPGGRENLQSWVIGVPVRLEALGTLDGPTVGKAQLRRILYVALGALTELPDVPVEDGQVIITDVGSSIAGGYVPLADGRPRYVATVMVTAHIH